LKRSIVIVGAGAGGLCMGMQLARAGHREFTIVERSDGIAGTWHDNRYPGAACDVPSHLYCFSFAPNPDWRRKFAPQPEIEAYLRRCADELGLAPHLRLGTEVLGARFVDGRWRIATSRGELVADVLVCSTGQLNRPSIPALPGLDTFAGRRFHSARWDTARDVRGEDVVVIGSGASSVQIVPEIAPLAKHLTLMQRSPNYVIPRNDRAYRDWERWLFRRAPALRKLYRGYIWCSLEARFTALHRDSLMGKLVRWGALKHLADSVVDPELRAKLTPDYPLGCKRILISDDWYPALVRDNVSVVTSPIARIEPRAVVTADGASHPADTIVFATGFETTSFLAPMEIVANGVPLTDAWRRGAEAHHGIAVAGFPNLFLTYGPNTNLGHNSILLMIECQVDYILQCLRELDRRGAHHIEVRRDAMARSNAELQRQLADTVWVADCHNWYKNADGRVTNNWSGRTLSYWWRTRAPNFADYDIVGA
jgi:cation diffusion facilitator CzcD-associated flavoprotein CzcO